MRKLAMEELGRLSPEDFKNTKKNPLVLVLDDVRSGHNVGSAFRTADAFLAEKIWLAGITGTPPHPDIRKTALGATETVAWEHRQQVVELVEQLKAEDYRVIAFEQVAGSLPLHQYSFQPEAKYALVFGNEVLGVKEEILTLAEAVLEIPQFGSKHSLNVAVSLGMGVWEWWRQTQGR